MSIQADEESYDVGKSQYVAYIVNQGDLTIAATRVKHALLKSFGKTWGTPVVEGDAVTFGTVNNQVVYAAQNEQEHVGWATSDPVPGKATKHVPDNAIGAHSDILFVVDVEIHGGYQRTVPRDVVGGATAPTLGQSLLFSNAQDQAWEGKGSLTNTNAVTGFTTTEITAIWKYIGKWN